MFGHRDFSMHYSLSIKTRVIIILGSLESRDRERALGALIPRYGHVGTSHPKNPHYSHKSPPHIHKTST